MSTAAVAAGRRARDLLADPGAAHLLICVAAPPAEDDAEVAG